MSSSSEVARQAVGGWAYQGNKLGCAADPVGSAMLAVHTCTCAQGRVGTGYYTINIVSVYMYMYLV